MNQIHPTAIIDDRVELGNNNIILPNTIIIGPTKIGDGNIIGPNVVIGSPGQDTRNPRYDSSDCYIEIGSNNIIREFSAIQKPCYRDITKIGNNVFIMQSVHIPHDAVLYDNVVVTPMCVLSGITTLLTGANIGIGCGLHQNSVVGHYSLIGMGSSLVKNIRPFTIFVTAKKPRVNYYALKKFNLEEQTDEISRYVLEGVMPISDHVLKMVDEFERIHKDSKRELYI
jgi:UDP-N-acetylglucosamine acyltransferase